MNKGYDLIRCEALLPDGFVSFNDFQSTDLTRDYTRYTITEDGVLVRSASLCGLPLRPVETNHDGQLRFYTTDSEDRWYEYIAEFAKGKMVKVSKVLDIVTAMGHEDPAPEREPAPAATEPATQAAPVTLPSKRGLRKQSTMRSETP